VAERVRALVPEARIGVAHGQLPPAELETVMQHFLEGEIEVLVTTAIIENGLDVPTANTMIVDRADHFGLSQLYQLRGRVGRSHHRAYCYLVVPEGVTDEAERRLRVLEHYTELGSGYAIALKDLELRGAGNLLGSEQSGFVHAVGLDTYTRLLEETVRALRDGVSAEPAAPAEISLEGAALLPDGYIPEDAQKLHIYRRLSRLHDAAAVRALADEARDRYGPLPAEAARLFDAASLRILATAAGVDRVTVSGNDARVTFRAGTEPRLAALQAPLRDRQVELEVRRTSPFSFVLRSYGAHAIADTLAAALEALQPAQRAAA
jgi:transcription-repair coupling factor (superfamily II helicase)